MACCRGVGVKNLRQRDRATRIEQCVATGTRGAGPEDTMDRTALRKPEPQLESGLRQSDRNHLMRTPMSGGVGAEGSIPSATRLGGCTYVMRTKPTTPFMAGC